MRPRIRACGHEDDAGVICWRELLTNISTKLFICAFIYLSIYPFIHLPINSSIHLTTHYLFLKLAPSDDDSSGLSTGVIAAIVFIPFLLLITVIIVIIVLLLYFTLTYDK